MCNTFAIYSQMFVAFGYKKMKNSECAWIFRGLEIQDSD